MYVFRLGMGALVLAVAATAASAQSSILYATASQFNQQLHAFQGGQHLFSFGGFPNDFEAPIAISGGTIRTTGDVTGVFGQAYNFAGTPLGQTYAATVDDAYDGTSDGTFNYTVVRATREVYRFDLNWQNPELLFAVSLPTTSAFVGITYDGTNNSLWLSGYDLMEVHNYSMNGTFLSSFNTGHNFNIALALDPVDQTLWLVDQNQLFTTLRWEQYDKAGNLLQTVDYDNLADENVIGAEFGPTAVPEPTTLALVGLVAGGVACWRWRRLAPKSAS